MRAKQALTLTSWQHRLNQEHPKCTERKSLTKECGWKGGDRGGLAERDKCKKLWKEQKKLLTGIGLLMEGLVDRRYLDR